MGTQKKKFKSPLKHTCFFKEKLFYLWDIQKSYTDSQLPNGIINDINDILSERSDDAYQEYTKLNQLKAKLRTD